MTFSPFDHPFLGGLLGDEEIDGYFSADADIRAMLTFEGALAKAVAEAGLMPEAAAERIAMAAAALDPDLEKLRITVSVDGVVVPGLVRQLRAALGNDDAAYVHFGATSQDAIDTSLMLRLKPALTVLAGRLTILVQVLDQLALQFGRNRLAGHTRMQPAIAIPVADRVRSWRAPLRRDRDRLRACLAAGLPLQFGGAAGTLEKFGDKAAAVRAALAAGLGLVDQPQWHNQRDRIAEIASLLSLTTGSLGKFGQDVLLLAQAGDEIVLTGGGGSSAMPHKHNPIGAEVLVALARFNATLLAGVHSGLVHEQERSGTAWTLEWLMLPQMVCATAAALRHAVEVAGNIRRLGEPNP